MGGAAREAGGGLGSPQLPRRHGPIQLASQEPGAAGTSKKQERWGLASLRPSAAGPAEQLQGLGLQTRVIAEGLWGTRGCSALFLTEYAAGVSGGIRGMSEGFPGLPLPLSSPVVPSSPQRSSRSLARALSLSLSPGTHLPRASQPLPASPCRTPLLPVLRTWSWPALSSPRPSLGTWSGSVNFPSRGFRPKQLSSHQSRRVRPLGPWGTLRQDCPLPGAPRCLGRRSGWSPWNGCAS